MTGSKRARRLRYVTVEIVPLRSLLLAFFLTLGIVCGYVSSERFAAGTDAELRGYLESYPTLAAGRALTAETAVRTLLCYLRAPVLAFLLGFASIGVAALPLLFAAQGFLLSFSLVSFAIAAGRGGFALVAALFGIRVLFVLPCTFLLGTAALEKAYALALLSGGGKRTRPIVYGASYWYRFAVCCVLLFLGCALELWLTPLLLAR